MSETVTVMPNTSQHPVTVISSNTAEVVKPTVKPLAALTIDDVMAGFDNVELRDLAERGLEAAKHYGEFVRIGTSVVRDVLDFIDRWRVSGGRNTL